MKKAITLPFDARITIKQQLFQHDLSYATGITIHVCNNGHNTALRTLQLLVPAALPTWVTLSHALRREEEGLQARPLTRPLRSHGSSRILSRSPPSATSQNKEWSDPITHVVARQKVMHEIDRAAIILRPQHVQ